MTERVPKVASGLKPDTAFAISWKSTVPKRTNASSTPSTNPKSPILLTMNAFLPALAAEGFWYQKPMRRYEHKPTPSHPTNITRKFAPRTSTSMNAANRFKYQK